MSFLRSVAANIFDEHRDHLQDLTVVLPSQRSCLFFLKYLAEMAHTAVISPDVLTMEQFATRIAGQEPTEYSKLLLALMEAARQHAPERCTSLSEFMSWGPIVLNDFNALDEHLIDPTLILTNTARAKILEQWQVQPNIEKGELERKFEAFYESLPKLYTAFVELLLQKKFTTRGLVYRKATERVYEQMRAGNKVYFIGFNALTKAEYELIAKLLNAQYAEFIGDFDQYYCTHVSNHEAGTFYRKWKEKGILSVKSFITNDLLTKEKNIYHHLVTGRAHQTQILSQLIEQKKENGVSDFRRVAVVLPDETMLFPILHHLPKMQDGINVTMQMPLDKLPVYQWIVSFIKAIEFVSRSESKGQFYYRHIKDVLSHPISFSFFDTTKIYKLLQEITENNLIFISHSKVNEALFDSSSSLFAPVISPQELIDKTLSIIELGIKRVNRNDVLQAEQLFMVQEVFSELKEVVAGLSSDFLKLQDLGLFMDSTAAAYGISLRGEPVQGLQIMGMLETRLLDFDTVFVLSANDDVLPKSSVYQSVIPYDIAVAHGLPEHRHQQAVYSYHFYQLLRNSKEIHLLSYLPVAGTQLAIPSRYTYQLAWELAAENPAIRYADIHHSLTPKVSSQSFDFQIKKDKPFVRDVIQKLKIKGLSPTHLANYIERPKDFYTHYILGLQDEDEVVEQADARIKGNAVHNTLKRLYKPFLNKEFPSADELEEMEPLIDPILEEELHNELPNADWSSGRNYLEKFLTRQMILNQLQLDKNRLKSNHLIKKHSSIVYLENPFKTHLNVPEIGEIKLYGIVDRIEKNGRHYHIIDYKTGAAPANKHFDLTGIDFFDKEKRKKAGKPLQLMCYMLMVADSLGAEDAVFSASLHFIKVKKDNEKYIFKQRNGNNYSFEDLTLITHSKEELETYRAVVIDLIQEIIDLETPENQIFGE